MHVERDADCPTHKKKMSLTCKTYASVFDTNALLAGTAWALMLPRSINTYSRGGRCLPGSWKKLEPVPPERELVDLYSVCVCVFVCFCVCVCV